MISINRDKCGYCGACVGVCPSNALELMETRIVVGKKCDECKLCVKMCPVGALEAER